MSQQFSTIYQDHYDKVYRLCLGYVNGDETLAKDLTQDVFIKVWEHLDQFKHKSSIGTWIYRITVNTCLLFIRKHKKGSYSLTEVVADKENVVQEEKDHQNRLKQMYACIQELKETERIVILLVLEGLPQKEIAEITGHSHQNIRVMVHRIKEKLTKCVSHGI